MKRLLLPAAVLLLAVVAAIVWWAGGGAGDRPETRPIALAPHGAEDEPDARPGAELAGAAPRPESEAPRAGGAAGDERLSVDELERRLARRDAERIEGRVRFAAGCSDDDTLELFALAEETGAGRLHRILDGGAGERDDEDDDGPFESAPRPAAPGREAILAAVEVGRDGAFRLPVAPEPATVHLTLRGDTHYLADSVRAAPGESSVELVARCGALLSGKVVAPPGWSGDVGPVRLELETRMESFSPGGGGERIRRTVETGADGTFAFRGLPAAMAFTIDLSAERFAASRTDVPALRPGERRAIEIQLALGARVTGRVVDEAGVPVAGAEVQAARKGMFFGFDNRRLRAGKSGPDGGFTLDAVASGKVLLRASVDGYLESEEVALELVEGATHAGSELVVLAGDAVAGRVAWPDGRPASGVAVKVRFDVAHMYGMGAFNARRGASGGATAGADGAFRATGLGKGPFTVTAEAQPEGAEGPAWKARADGVTPGTLDLALVLEQPLALRGIVVDADGAPVTAYRIVAQELGEGILGNLGRQKEERAVEDPAGRFEIEGLRSGSWNVFALAEGYGLPEPLALTLPDAAVDELRIVLARASRVAGTVVGPQGNPVGGAEVAVDTGGPSWQAALENEFERPKTKCAADGTFTLDGLSPGQVALRAKADGFARSDAVSIELAEGEHKQEVELRLRAGATLTGEVYGAGGAPAAGMFVQATSMTDFDNRFTTSDGEGRFKLEHLDAGTWQVVALPAGLGARAAGEEGEGGEAGEMAAMMKDMKIAVVELEDGGAEHVVLGAPPADPVRVSGSVTHDGRPYAGAMVTFLAEGGNALQSMRYSSVDDAGRYAVELEKPGTYVVQIQMLDGGMTQQRMVEFSRVVPEVEETVLDFEIPTGRVSGTVEDDAGRPLSGVRVSLHPEGALATGTFWGGQYVESTSDSEGRYDIQGLRPGRYSLMAGGMAYGGMLSEKADFGRQVKSVAIDEGRWLEGQDFRMERAGTLAVRVVDAAGKPVAQAAVFVRDAGGRLLDRLSLISTDGSGACSYGGVAPGAFTISARKGELSSRESEPVRVDSGEATAVELRMEPGTILIVTLEGDTGELLRANVSVQDEDGREVSGMVALSDIMAALGKGFTSEEHRVGPLPPGRYRVTAELSDGRSVKKPVTLTGKAERRLNLRFD